jgi:alcohol dehydrogenase class IV
VKWLEVLVRTLKVPGLGAYGLTKNDVPDVVRKAAVASSMKANPIVLKPEELAAILERAL